MENQQQLFDVPANWEKEWAGMPEFVQNKKSEFSKIIIRFATQEDLRNFSELIKQKLTPETKSIWFPFRSHWGQSPNLQWHDES